MLKAIPQAERNAFALNLDILSFVIKNSGYVLGAEGALCKSK
jgi:hypothetical protein